MSASFCFGPGLVLSARGNRPALRHLAREYGASLLRGAGEPDVELAFARLPRGTGVNSGGRFEGAYKTVSWRVGLGPPGERTLRATVELGGRPRSFAHSLVQGYVVEALLGVAASRPGMVLLPAAALERNGRALVILGRSGSGKSSLMVRALAAGRRVLADDQVLIDGAGRCWSFHRRIRVYPDLRLTAPVAYRRLGAGRRAALGARRVAAALTRGYVGPSLALAFPELGKPPPSGPLPLGPVVLIDRRPGREHIETSPLSADEALAAAQRTLEEQRAELQAPSAAWREELQATVERERQTLAGAFAAARLQRLSVPDAMGAGAAVATLARLLHVEG